MSERLEKAPSGWSNCFHRADESETGDDNTRSQCILQGRNVFASSDMEDRGRGPKKVPDDCAIWIDVWFPSHEEARRWGRRKVEVTIVEPCEAFDRGAFHPTHPPERK